MALAAAGAAVAYFTSSGSGTGTAAVGTSSSLTISGSTSGSLYPGTSATVSFTVANPSTANQQLGTIHLASIVACSVAFSGGACPTGNAITSCESVETGASDTNTANFYMPDVVAAQTFGTGSGQTVTARGTLTMNNLSTSQDACKSANLLLNFTS